MLAGLLPRVHGLPVLSAEQNIRQWQTSLEKVYKKGESLLL